MSRQDKVTARCDRIAESYGPQDHELYLHMARLDEGKGEVGRADGATGKAIEYRLFPTPQ